MTNESAIFIEPNIVFGEIQPLLENKILLFHIHRKKLYPLLNVMLAITDPGALLRCKLPFYFALLSVEICQQETINQHQR
jgi:hypothetical protein